MTVYVCKMCGRAVRAEQKPNFCYFDRMDCIENLSDEDADKMDIFKLNTVDSIVGIDGIEMEFIGDMVFHPMTGEPVTHISGPTLEEFQGRVMDRVGGVQ